MSEQAKRHKDFLAILEDEFLYQHLHAQRKPFTPESFELDLPEPYLESQKEVRARFVRDLEYMKSLHESSTDAPDEAKTLNP